jgi:hypothetical protein
VVIATTAEVTEVTTTVTEKVVVVTLVKILRSAEIFSCKVVVQTFLYHEIYDHLRFLAVIF